MSIVLQRVSYNGEPIYRITGRITVFLRQYKVSQGTSRCAADPRSLEWLRGSAMSPMIYFSKIIAPLFLIKNKSFVNKRRFDFFLVITTDKQAHDPPDGQRLVTVDSAMLSLWLSRFSEITCWLVIITLFFSRNSAKSQRSQLDLCVVVFRTRSGPTAQVGKLVAHSKRQVDHQRRRGAHTADLF